MRSVGTPQKETPTMPYGADAQNFGAVPEGVQGKEPQTPPMITVSAVQSTMTLSTESAKHQGVIMLNPTGKEPQTFEEFWGGKEQMRSDSRYNCANRAFSAGQVSGEAAGRRSATLLEKNLFGALKAILATVGAADYDDVQLVDTSAIERAKTIVACAELLEKP